MTCIIIYVQHKTRAKTVNQKQGYTYIYTHPKYTHMYENK